MFISSSPQPRPYYRDELPGLAQQPHAVIIDCQRVEHIDFTAAEVRWVCVRGREKVRE